MCVQLAYYCQTILFRLFQTEQSKYPFCVFLELKNEVSSVCTDADSRFCCSHIIA